MSELLDPNDVEIFWNDLVEESQKIAKNELVLEDLLNRHVLSCKSLSVCLARIISSKLASREVDRQQLFSVCMQAYTEDPNLLKSAVADVLAVANRDPTSKSIVRILLFLKGPHVIESFRVANWLWKRGRIDLASYIQSRISEVFHIENM